ncbi:MAG: hypothetical protein DBX66_04270 [Clostridiales bacterium]|uniref:hypothetical protein n=1 Tax=Provencibacterium massiliense TaxID=1841868 RepID=UPI0009A8D1B1|nr:hypothetical protein [Provencibacterium massiliense]PWM38099.1 MAG: hypothetical protein DBX66_04270 [Clostridiales bacterium]RGB69628.1 hypothetical protein DW086_00340 [Harryflintia acetispora]
MKRKIIVASLCSVAVILSGVTGYQIGSRPAPASNPEVIERIAGSIYVPGYDYISMKEDDTEIPAMLYNPEENGCLIEAAISLPDGTEIFHSDLLNPGDRLGKLTLTAPIKAGVYEKSILRYSCYALDDKRQLNGADVIFTLEVKP